MSDDLERKLDGLVQLIRDANDPREMCAMSDLPKFTIWWPYDARSVAMGVPGKVLVALKNTSQNAAQLDRIALALNAAVDVANKVGVCWPVEEEKALRTALLALVGEGKSDGQNPKD